LPNLFTAAADSLAGWVVVSGSLAHPERWGFLVAASVVTYAAGIVLNDVFDLEVDRVERPGRPLPSGQVSPRLAGWAGGILLALGPILAGFSGSMMSFAVALALSACVLGYDAGLKRTGLGPWVMGACRGLNLALGLSQAEAFGGPPAWLAVAGFTAFVSGLTWISRSEVAAEGIRGIVRGAGLQAAALVGLAGTTVMGGGWTGPTASPWLGLLVLLAVATVNQRANLRAIRDPIPLRVQAAVKTGVFALVWLDVAIAAAASGPVLALVVAALWVPAFVTGRWLYST
jgi:4-hydroxybenzoate polyprenyltransferase